jgi:hypothetical protein
MLVELKFQFYMLRTFFLGVYSREWKLPVLFIAGSCNSPYIIWARSQKMIKLLQAGRRFSSYRLKRVELCYRCCESTFLFSGNQFRKSLRSVMNSKWPPLLPCAECRLQQRAGHHSFCTKPETDIFQQLRYDSKLICMNTCSLGVFKQVRIWYIFIVA